MSTVSQYELIISVHREAALRNELRLSVRLVQVCKF